MREMSEKEIDGHFYKIVQFNTTKSLQIFEELGCILGEPLSSVFALGLNEEEKQPDSINEAKLIGEVVKTLFEKSRQHNGIGLIKKILAEDSFLCDGKTVDFDLHFSGGKGLAHLMKVLTAVLEVQYGDFLGDLRGAVASKSLSGSPSTTPKTSTGDFGESSSQDLGH